jgi:hypothetical protein
MKSKSIIIFVIAAGVLAGALVFDGMTRRHTANGLTNAPATAATTTATAPADSSSASAQTQPAAAANATTQTADATTSAAPQPQADASAATADATSADAAQPADAPQPAPQPIVVPAGTALTIRLGETLGSKISESNQIFSATLDRDVVIAGQTVIGAGANVTGRVVVARPSGQFAGEATLQLRITSVNVNNADLAIASSTQSFGPKIKGKSKVGRFMKGLVKRAEGDEHEVELAKESAYSFTLKKNLQIE